MTCLLVAVIGCREGPAPVSQPAAVAVPRELACTTASDRSVRTSYHCCQREVALCAATGAAEADMATFGFREFHCMTKIVRCPMEHTPPGACACREGRCVSETKDRAADD